ncbi:MAG: hypothetical protein JNM88_04075 [Chitinophagaceae bacterium]|nr:hypothetical protein [Chitinophagaceae bacterium]
MKAQFLTWLTLLLGPVLVNAQTELAPDQNPNYAISRDKYMKMADSMTKWHGTTLQNTYQAIDWLADRERARKNRIDFRRQLRLERARWNGYNYRNDGYYDPYNSYNNSYYNSFNNYNRGNRWQRPRFWWW